MDLEASKSAYINRWTHCGKRLDASNAQIACECGERWPWEATLGETMEWLETTGQLRPADGLPAPVVEGGQPKLFG